MIDFVDRLPHIQLIAFARKLAVGQILNLSSCDEIKFFSRLSHRVVGTGWQALPANCEF